MIIRWMEAAGFILSTRQANGQQHGFDLAGGKIAGHIDGVLLSGSDQFHYPALRECKTMSGKYWRDFVKKRVTLSHPHYVAQIQLYMAYMNLTENSALLTA